MRWLNLLLIAVVLVALLPVSVDAQSGGGSSGGGSSGGGWGDPPADRASPVEIAWYYGYAQCFEAAPVLVSNGWSVDFPDFDGYKFRVLNDWLIDPSRWYFGASPSRPLVVVASPWHPLPSLTIWRHWSLPINAFFGFPHPLGAPLTQQEYITIDVASIYDVWNIYLCDYATVSSTPTPTPTPAGTPTSTTIPYDDYECWEGSPVTTTVNFQPYITLRFTDAIGVLFTSGVTTTQINWLGRYAYELPPGRSFLMRVDSSIASQVSGFAVARLSGFPPSGAPGTTLPYSSFPAVYTNNSGQVESIEFRGGYVSSLTPRFLPEWASLVQLCVPRSYFPTPTPLPTSTPAVSVTRTVVWTPTPTLRTTPTPTPTVTRTPTVTPSAVPSPSPVSTSAAYINTIVPIALTPLPDSVDSSGSLLEDIQVIFDQLRRLLSPSSLSCSNLPSPAVPASSSGGFASPSMRDVFEGVCALFVLVSPVTHWARPFVTVFALLLIVGLAMSMLRSAL